MGVFLFAIAAGMTPVLFLFASGLIGSTDTGPAPDGPEARGQALQRPGNDVDVDVDVRPAAMARQGR